VSVFTLGTIIVAVVAAGFTIIAVRAFRADRRYPAAHSPRMARPVHEPQPDGGHRPAGDKPPSVPRPPDPPAELGDWTEETLDILRGDGGPSYLFTPELERRPGPDTITSIRALTDQYLAANPHPEPIAVIGDLEAAQIREGILEAERGETIDLGSFAQYAGEPDDDGPHRFQPDTLAVMAEEHYPVVGESLEPLPPHAAPDVAQNEWTPGADADPAAEAWEGWLNGERDSPDPDPEPGPVPFTAEPLELDAGLAARWASYPVEAFRRALLTADLDKIADLFTPAGEPVAA
jgi:hypothetical protein